MNEFFSDLARRLRVAAARRGAAIDDPVLDPAVADQLLELARVVAHGKERRFAPLASFVAGVAAERFRLAKGTDVASLIREVREELEREIPPSEAR